MRENCTSGFVQGRPATGVPTLRYVMSDQAFGATQSRRYLDLAYDDYLASRLLLCTGLLAPGASLAATAVEKHLKAVLALKRFHTKKHLESPIFNALKTHFPELHKKLDMDFMKFLKRAFRHRYSAVDGQEFGIVINQNRTLLVLDQTIALINSGFDVSEGETPLNRGVKRQDSILMDRNVPPGGIELTVQVVMPNMVEEFLSGPKPSDTFGVKYQTEGLNVTGNFMKRPQFNFKTGKGKVSKG